jgi:anthranilate phosphoribosyltransferase
MGVYAAHLVPIVAEAMRQLSVRHAFVVHGAVGESGSAKSGLDEFSISGPTQFAEVYGDAVTFDELRPEQVGLHSAPLESLRGGDAVANAAILRAIFAGEPGPCRDVVLLNAAAVLITAGVVPTNVHYRHESFRAGIALAASAIDSGAVARLVDSLARKS